jgi:thiol-disulfide isomerase/thioredoxin
MLVAGGSSAVLLLAGCGGGASTGSNALHPSGPAGAGTPTSTAAPATGAHAKAKTRKGRAAAKAAASASASAAAASSQAPATNSGGHSHKGSSPTSAPQAAGTPAPIVVNSKCRKPASSVGTGVAVKGQRPPDFTGTTQSCGALTMSAVTKGKPALVDFYASWCHPCQQEAKDLEAVYKEWHPKNGFAIVAVETQDESGDPTWFYKNAGYSFQSVWDDGEKIRNAWNTTGAISTLPAAFWIHADGTVSDVVIGQMSKQQMETEMGKL